MVATRQLAALGYTKSSVAKAAKAGRLHRVHRGVYVVGHRRLTWHGRCMAAVLASSPSVASHLSAGWLWGLLRSRPGTVHVTCRDPAARRATLRRARGRPGAGRPGPAGRDPGHFPGAHDPRPRRRLVGRGPSGATSSAADDDEDLRPAGDGRPARAHARGTGGGAKVRAALEIYEETAGLHPLRARAAVPRGRHRRRAPAARDERLRRRATRSTPTGPSTRFGVELDVYETHGSRLSFEEDRVRDDELLLAGIETTRVTGPRLDREPGAVVDSLRRHLARGRALE